MRVTWKAAPGPVVSYRLTYVPRAGGKEMTMKIPANVTTTMLRKLQPLTTYLITVHPIYKRGEGKARQGVGTTRTLANNSKPMSHRSVQTQAYITSYTGKNDVLPQYSTVFQYKYLKILKIRYIYLRSKLLYLELNVFLNTLVNCWS